MKAKIKDLQENEMKFGMESQSYPEEQQTQSENDSNQEYYSKEEDSEVERNINPQYLYDRKPNLPDNLINNQKE